MRLLVAALLLVVVVAAFGGCEGDISYCSHSGWVKATVIKEHDLYPDTTAAEVRNHADWTSGGMWPDCEGLLVESMRRTPPGSDFWNLCYWNPTQDGTELTACKGELHSVTDWWNHANVDGYFTASKGRAYQLWTTVYAAQDRSFSGSCSVHNGTVPSGSRFVCTPHQDR